MSKVLREFGINGDKALRYNLCKAPGTNLSDMAGQRIQVKAYVLLESENADGQSFKALKFLTDDGEFVGTNSGPFIQGFEEFLDLMETDEITEFEAEKAKSRKSGRTFLSFKA